MTKQEIIIKLHCHNLPGKEFEGRCAVRLGVQKGNEVIEDVSADEREVTFIIPLRVEKNPRTGKPNFLGPFAHGTADERFIYLNWGERKDGLWVGFRRAKIHLKHLGWERFEEAMKGGQTIEATVGMTDAKGGPVCASVKESYIRWTSRR